MSEIKAENQHTPPFHKEDVDAIKAPLPFTSSFNLDEPSMIDLSFLNEQEKLALLKELEKRQNHQDPKTTWNKDHANLLFALQAQLNKNKIANDYVPLKDQRIRY